ncbi:MAG: GNAT family N-acetyltransferase [Ktedonobacterales bacterium]
MPHQRHKMCVELTLQTPAVHLGARHVSANDVEGLARLMLAAYRGTIDDEGDTLDGARAEIQRTLAAAYGTFLPNCSWLIADGDTIRAACLVTYFDMWQAPIVAFVMTDPASKGQGLGTNLIKHSMNSLLGQGYTRLCLAVTEGNAPAQHVYNLLGFEIEESWVSG